MKKRNVLVGAIAGLMSVAGVVAVVGGDLSEASMMAYTEGTVSAEQLVEGDVVYPGVTITDSHCFEVETENSYYCTGYDQGWGADVVVNSSYVMNSGETVTAPNGWVFVWRDSVVNPCIGFMANGEPAPQPELIQVTGDSGCAHEMDEWVYVTLVNEEEDAYMSQVCSKCGCLSTTVKGGDGRKEASAYWYFGEVVRQEILHAEAYETIEVSTEVWISFSKEVMQALSERSDVTVVLTYKNPKDGQHYQMTMKGADAIELDDLFYGYVHLSKYYPTVVVE